MALTGRGICTESVSLPKELWARKKDILIVSLLCVWDVRWSLQDRDLVWESWLVLVWENGNELSGISSPSGYTLSAGAMISLPGILSDKCDFTLTQLPSVLSAWQSKWFYCWCLNAQWNWNMNLVLQSNAVALRQVCWSCWMECWEFYAILYFIL